VTDRAVIVALTAFCAVACAVPLRRPCPRTPPGPHLRLRPPRPRRAAVAAVAAVLVVATDPMLASLLVVIAASAARMRAIGLARRRGREIGGALPDAMELLVVMIHAGCSPVQAMLAARPLVDVRLRPAFDAVEHRLQRGRRLADAITALNDHLGAGVTGMVDAIAAAERYGLPLAPALERLATEARAARHRANEAAARTLPVRLSFPLVVCTLPSFVLLAIVPAVLGTLSSLRGHAP
jgi:tight adherence protein C